MVVAADQINMKNQVFQQWKVLLQFLKVLMHFTPKREKENNQNNLLKPNLWFPS